jgi:N-acetylglucosaminyldiphosphoundecaprenol N-acetyl-beta-D-mannosaminyltransferase
MHTDTYFNIRLEFNHSIIHNQICNIVESNQKGYVCVVDANVLTIAQKNFEYRAVLNHSTFNTCDGSSIAMMASKIHKKKLRALNGPDIFSNYIEKDYKQLLLGSTEETVCTIKDVLKGKGETVRICSIFLYLLLALKDSTT